MRINAAEVSLLIALSSGACNYKPAGPSGYLGGMDGGAAGASGAGGGDAGAGTTGSAGRGFDASLPEVLVPPPDAGDPTSTPDVNCGALGKDAARLAPNIVILMDVSRSMNESADLTCRMNCGANSKWSQMAEAISSVVTTTDTTVNWGLKFFPEDTACAVGPGAQVPVGQAKGADITAAIADRTDAMGNVVRGGNTPTRAGVNAAAAYLTELAEPNPKAILLATDGLPSCDPNAPMGPTVAEADGTVTAIETAFTAGVPTFVVGVATSTDPMADTTMSRAAVAGGHPRSGMPSYYSVANTADLVAALGDIIGIVATCTFQVGPAPNNQTSVDHIDVYGDGMEIERDTTRADGWDYTDASHQAIEVFGPTCEAIKSATITNVTVTFRCLVS